MSAPPQLVPRNLQEGMEDEEEEEGIVVEEGSDVGAFVSQAQLSNMSDARALAEIAREEDMSQGPLSSNDTARVGAHDSREHTWACACHV